VKRGYLKGYFKVETIVLLIFLVLALTLGMGCETEVSVSTAKLSNIAMASEVNEATKEPVTITDTFYPNSEIIYCTAKLENAPPGTKIKYVWYYTEPEEDIEITSWEGEATEGGSSYIYCYLTRPDQGWPLGQYMVKVYLDNKEVGNATFKVVPSEGGEQQ